MTLIADPTAVMTALGYDTSMTNITAAATDAMDAATTSLASALQTNFDQAVVVDTFFVMKPSDYQRFDNFKTEFRLSQGFINATPAPVVIYAETAPALTDSMAVSDVSNAMAINTEKGVAVDVMNEYARSWVRFTYTKGFPLSQSDNTVFDLSVVPQWLQNAAKILTKISLQSNPSLEDPAIKLDTKLLQAQLSGILKPHLRYTPAAMLPIITEMFGMPIQPTATEPAPLPSGDPLELYGYLPVGTING